MSYAAYAYPPARTPSAPATGAAAPRPAASARPLARPAAAPGGGYAGNAARYRDAELASASPAQLVVLLFDKCLLTVRRAEAAFTDSAARTEYVCLAADMLAELRAALDFEAGDGGALSRQLDALYAWAGAELHRALREQVPAPLAGVLRVVGELRDAFAGAQAQLAAQGAPSAPAARSA
jgi:flagellar protein FliS